MFKKVQNLGVLENSRGSRNLEILEIPPAKRTLRQDPFSGPDKVPLMMPQESSAKKELGKKGDETKAETSKKRDQKVIQMQTSAVIEQIALVSEAQSWRK